MAAKKKEDAKTRTMAVTKKKEDAKTMKKEEDVSGRKCLEILGSADPKQWLAAPPELVKCVRTASEYLFSVLGTHTESELRQLLTQNFDPEQIWQQIDLQATPALDKIKASLRTLESSPRLELFRLKNKPRDSVRSQAVEENGDSEEDEDELLDAGEVSGSDDEEEEDEVDEDGEEDDELEEYSDYDEEEKKAVEDKFLKLSDMEKFLDRADAEEAGIVEDDDDDDDDGEEDDDEGDDDEVDDDDLELDEAFDFSARAADRENGDSVWGPKYSDFIGKGKKKETKLLKKKDSDDEFEEDDLGEGDEDEEEEDDDEELGTMDIEPVEEKKLSAHERQQEKTKRRIEQLEKANLESKDWTMQGEVSASRRSKNSALEVELDFEHGARPAPVITEEVTQSLEDMIRSRIIEGNFDDPQPRAAPVTAIPKERIEMDEEKSKKGLGEIYEQQYMESTGLAVAATPATETLKAEATILFKNLCHKLDALSHFHFAPKPVVEEMEVKVDVPALAMEEVAPIAVSDASMLAPEEVFKSAGLIKGESELTPEERKRRRAQKKRKRKGAKNAAENLKKLRPNNVSASGLPKESIVRSKYTDNRTTSTFSKSAKVFGELDKAQERGNKAAKPDNSGVPTLHASSLKL